MLKTSETSLSEALQAMVKNEIGVVVLQADGNEEEFEKLCKDHSYQDTVGGFAGETLVASLIYPLHKKNHSWPTPLNLKESAEEIHSFTEMRDNAIQNIFVRWDLMGRNRYKARSPYNSKPFMRYLNAMEFSEADYLLMRIG